MNWITTTEKPHPDKPGLARYEHIPCLVVYHGEICIRQWNCEYLVWDEEDGDDFCCKADEVTHWMPLPPMPNKEMIHDYIRDPVKQTPCAPAGDVVL